MRVVGGLVHVVDVCVVGVWGGVCGVCEVGVSVEGVCGSL